MRDTHSHAFVQLVDSKPCFVYRKRWLCTRKRKKLLMKLKRRGRDIKIQFDCHLVYILIKNVITNEIISLMKVPSIMAPGMQQTYHLSILFFVNLICMIYERFWVVYFHLIASPIFYGIGIVCVIASARFAYFANDFPWRILNWLLLFILHVFRIYFTVIHFQKQYEKKLSFRYMF